MITTDNEGVEINSEDLANGLTDNQTPEKGRVWRRRSAAVCSKHSDGPVLRATVKPVKRFQPESTPVGGTDIYVSLNF